MWKAIKEINQAQKDVRAIHREQNGSPSRLTSASRYAPLLAALLAPLSTLYDIPALTQKWYSLKSDGTPVSDPTASLVLSAVGLAFNVIANGLLIMRFSSTSTRWRIATVMSLCFWVAKTILALVNVTVFGTRRGGRAQYTYNEGFYCAVISLIVAGTIAVLLVLHGALHRNDAEKFSKDVRIQGQHFMLSVMWLFGIVAIEALVMSRIEQWAYFDGIYFSVVTMFTIGLGDFTPTKPLSRVLLFPFALVTIAALGNQIGIVVEFFAARAKARKARWRALYESRQLRQAETHETGAGRATTDLEREMRFLTDLARREDKLGMLWDLMWSLIGFLVFWAAGAAVFAGIEGWAYGTSVYFTYVVLLTIGYGDFAPQTPAGRCVFVVYSLMAVPVVASFAVQTVTSVFGAIAARHLQQRRDSAGLEPSLKPAQRAREDGEERETEDHHFISHAEFVRRAHERWEAKETEKTKQGGDRSEQGSSSTGGEDAVKEEAEQEEQEVIHDEARLTDQVLELAVALEAQARSLLIGSLNPESKERVLLRADRNLQLRDVRYYGAQGKNARRDKEDDIEQWPAMQDQAQGSTLEQIRSYRETFATLLAVGSKLKGLQGEEQYLFERRRLPGSVEVDADGLPLRGSTVQLSQAD